MLKPKNKLLLQGIFSRKSISLEVFRGNLLKFNANCNLLHSKGHSRYPCLQLLGKSILKLNNIEVSVLKTSIIRP